MRFSQPKEEKRAWPAHFLSLVSELSRAYTLNRHVRGTRTECLRELVPGGLLVSHNSFCYRGTYHHCFGLALTPLFVEGHSPFFIGGRFDHNLDVAFAFMRHMGLTPQDRRERNMSWHSTHKWRAGTDDIVRRCTRTAEQYLLPFYLSRISASAGPLRDLLLFARDHVELPEADLRRLAGAIDPRTLDLGLYELTDPAHPWQAHAVPDKHAALLLRMQSAFPALRDVVPDMLQRLATTCPG